MQLIPKVGFIVFGVHKDGLVDPLGTPFIDDALIAAAKESLRAMGPGRARGDPGDQGGSQGLPGQVQAARGRRRHRPFLRDLGVGGAPDWPLRDFARTGKGIVLWTNPGSQGWRPVGGLVMHGALKEIGLAHRYVYGGYDDPETIEHIAAYCRACAMVTGST